MYAHLDDIHTTNVVALHSMICFLLFNKGSFPCKLTMVVITNDEDEHNQLVVQSASHNKTKSVIDRMARYDQRSFMLSTQRQWIAQPVYY